MTASTPNILADAALSVREGRDLVVGAAELEGTGALQDLRLEQDAAAELLVEGGRLDQFRVDDQPRKPCGGGAHILNSWKRLAGVGHGGASCFSLERGNPRDWLAALHVIACTHVAVAKPLRTFARHAFCFGRRARRKVASAILSREQ
jgi:hypothetical protein